MGILVQTRSIEMKESLTILTALMLLGATPQEQEKPEEHQYVITVSIGVA